MNLLGALYFFFFLVWDTLISISDKFLDEKLEAQSGKIECELLVTSFHVDKIEITTNYDIFNNRINKAIQ